MPSCFLPELSVRTRQNILFARCNTMFYLGIWFLTKVHQEIFCLLDVIQTPWTQKGPVGTKRDEGGEEERRHCFSAVLAKAEMRSTHITEIEMFL